MAYGALNLRGFLLFIFCLITVFAPKFGVLDFSILGAPIILAMLRWNGKFSRQLNFCILVLIALIIYQIFIQLISGATDIDSVLRLIRALLVCFLGAALLTVVAGKGEEIFWAAFLALVLHSFVVILAVMNDEVRLVLILFSGNELALPLRSSGFVAGYDMAGLMAVVGILFLVLEVVVIKNIFFKFLTMVILFGACIASSRISVFIGFLLIAGWQLTLLKRDDISRLGKFLTVIQLFIFLSFSTWLILIVAEITFSLGLVSVDPDTVNLVVSSHSVQSEDVFLWSDMFVLPDTVLKIIFGTGADYLESDVGYVKDIYRYGVFGLLIAFIFHVYILVSWVDMSKKWGMRNSSLRRLAFFLFLLMLVLTFKNNYFFTRVFFPLLIFLFVGVCAGSKDSYRRRCLNLNMNS